MDKIIEMTRELGKAIQQDARYTRISKAIIANDSDTDLQKQIKNFNLKRADLSAAMAQENKDADKLNALDKELKEMYQAIMENEHMVEFNNAKVDVDAMMNFVTEILYGSVNGEDPDTIEMHESCGGNCAGCGGCH